MRLIIIYIISSITRFYARKENDADISHLSGVGIFLLGILSIIFGLFVWFEILYQAKPLDFINFPKVKYKQYIAGFSLFFASYWLFGFIIPKKEILGLELNEQQTRKSNMLAITYLVICIGFFVFSVLAKGYCLRHY